MKKLISLSNIKSLHDKGQTEIYIDEQTIITPAAKDYAKFNGMVFVEKKGDCRMMNDFDISGLSKEDLYKILKVLVDKGLLDTDTKKYDIIDLSKVKEETRCKLIMFCFTCVDLVRIYAVRSSIVSGTLSM